MNEQYNGVRALRPWQHKDQHKQHSESAVVCVLHRSEVHSNKAVHQEHVVRQWEAGLVLQSHSIANLMSLINKEILFMF